jgi:VanZ family protein
MPDHKQTKKSFSGFNSILNPQITSWIFVVFWIYALFLLVMNLTPGNTQPLEMKKFMFVRIDYFFHATAYAILISIYFMAAVSPRPVFNQNKQVAGITIILLLATVPEILQNYVPQRRFNWWDMFANFTGLAVGTVGMLLFIMIFRKLKMNPF